MNVWMRLLVLIPWFFLPLGICQETDDDGGWQPTELGREEIGLLKGTTTYIFPIWTPTPRGAVNLPLQLVYNSGIVNAMTSEHYTDTGWLGVGWQLDLPRISVKNNNEGTYSISLNGVSGELLPAADGFLYPEEQPFMRVEKLDANHDALPAGDTDDHYFIATDKNGTRYWFGEVMDANQDPVENSSLATLGFTRESGKRVYRVFKLWKMKDRWGNSLLVSYQLGYRENGSSLNGPKNRVKESHPQSILYTANTDGGNDADYEYEVAFTVQGKSHPIESTYGEVKQYLKLLEVKYKGGDSAPMTLFTYTPEYSQFGAGHVAGKHIRLDRVIKRGNDPTLGSEITEFGYSNRKIHTALGFQNPFGCGEPGQPPCGQGGIQEYTREFLTTIDSPMGGQVIFEYGAHPLVRPHRLEYENNDCQGPPWESKRSDWFAVVTRKIMIDRIVGTQSVTDYHYRNPYFFTHVSNQNNDVYTANYSTFGGFAEVWVVDPESKVSQHQYKVSNALWDCVNFEMLPMAGREWRTTQYEKVTNRNPDADGDGVIDSPAFARSRQDFVQWYGEENSHWPQGAWYIYANQVTNTQWGTSYPQNTYPHGIWTRKAFEYDLFGNAVQTTTHETNRNDPALYTPPIKRIQLSAYKNHPNHWLVLKSYENVYAGDLGPEQVESSTVYLYDTDGTPTSHDFQLTGQLQPGSKGILNRQRNWADRRFIKSVPPIPYLAYGETSFTYDTYGNVVSRTTYADEGKWIQSAPFDHFLADHVHATTTSTYDNLHHLFVEETEVLGDNGAEALVLLDRKTFVHDPAYQKQVQTTDAAGRTSEIGYDALMRPIYTMKPADFEQDVVTTSTIYPSFDTWTPGTGHPFSVHHREAIDQNFKDSYTFYDGFSREIQNHVRMKTTYPTTDSFISTWAVAAKSYDVMGREIKTLAPLELTNGGPRPPGPLGFQPDPWTGNAFSLHKFNNKGQPMESLTPDDAKTIFYQDIDVDNQPHYTGSWLFLDGSVDPLGNARHNIKDAEGNLVKVRLWYRDEKGEYLLDSETQYSYDVANRLTSITDHQGNRFISRYDKLGRKVEMWDPDLSHGFDPNKLTGPSWTFDFDGAGNMITQVDARGVIHYTRYDGLNRPVSHQWSTPSGVAPSFDVTMEYDNDLYPGNYGVGQLERSFDLDGSVNEYSYDRWGRLFSQVISLGGRFGTYQESGHNTRVMLYNRDDQLWLEGRGDGTLVEYDYHPEHGAPTRTWAYAPLFYEDFDQAALDEAWRIRGWAVHQNGMITTTGVDEDTHLAVYRDYGFAGKAVCFDFMASGAAHGGFHLESGKYGNSNHRRFQLAVRKQAVSGGFQYKIKARRLVGSSKVTNETIIEGLQPNTWYRGAILAHEGRGNGFKIIIWNPSDSEQSVVFEETVFEGLDSLGNDIRFAMDIKSGSLSLDNFTVLDVAEPVAQVREFDYLGRPLVIDLAGGLTRTTNFFTWKEKNNRISDLTVSREGVVLMSLGYTYDDKGNITRMTDFQKDERDTVLNGVHTYGYDHLDRLVTATSTNNGADLLDMSWQYDELGNIRFINDALKHQETEYHYSGLDAGPHAVSGTTVNGSPDRSFRYDPSGNAIGWNGATLTFRAENKLGALELNNESWFWFYDGTGTRTVKEAYDSGGRLLEANIYLAGIERTINGSGKTTRTRQQFGLGGLMVGTWENGVLSVQHPDHLGSMLMASDGRSGLVRFWNRHKPFGGELLSGGEDRTDLDFTGQRKDRFVSIPVLDVTPCEITNCYGEGCADPALEGTFTISNTGNADMNGVTAWLVDPAGDFTLDWSHATVLQPGDSVPLTVRFNGDTATCMAGRYDVSVLVQTENGGSIQLEYVQIIYPSTGLLSVSPVNMTNTCNDPATCDLSGTFTLSAGSQTELCGLTANLTGPNSALFQLNNPNGTMDAGSSQDLVVTYTGPANGCEDITVNIQVSADNAVTQNLQYQQIIIPNANLEAPATAITQCYGGPGCFSLSGSFTLNNSGAYDMCGISANLAGPNSALFSLAPISDVLAAGDSQQLVINYTGPQTNGSYPVDVLVTSQNGGMVSLNYQQDINFPEPVINLATAQNCFGAGCAGNQSISGSFTISNPGAVTMTGINAFLDDTQNFQFEDTAPGSLAPGATSSSIAFTFTGDLTTEAYYPMQLTVAADHRSATAAYQQIIDTAPILNITPNLARCFGDGCSNPSVNGIFTITNTGDGPMTGIGLALSGPIQDFTAGTPVTSLPPGQSTNIPVSYTGTFEVCSTLTRILTLNITTDEAGDAIRTFTQNITTSNTTLSASPDISGNCIGDFCINDPDGQFTVTNTGNFQTCSFSASLSGEHSGKFTLSGNQAGNLPAGAGRTFTVAYTGPVVNEATDYSVTIIFNAANATAITRTYTQTVRPDTSALLLELPGSGTVQAYDAVATANTLYISLWRNNQPWHREVPILNNQLQYTAAGAWVQGQYHTGYGVIPASSNTNPIHSLDSYVVGTLLGQSYWRNDIGYERDIPYNNNLVDWDNASGWSATAELSDLQDTTHSVQAHDNYYLGGNTFFQSLWQNDISWGRQFPVNNGVIDWQNPSGWYSDVSLGDLPGAGSINAMSNFKLGNNMVQAWFQGNQGFWRYVAINNGAPNWNDTSDIEGPINP